LKRGAESCGHFGTPDHRGEDCSRISRTIAPQTRYVPRGSSQNMELRLKPVY
jgi:hypothetical protein